MSELITNAQAAIERLECEDWEVGPFDGHCLRLTCTRCLFQMVVREAAASRASEAAAQARIDTALAILNSRDIFDDDDQCRSCWTYAGDQERPESHASNCLLMKIRAILAAASGSQERQ